MTVLTDRPIRTPLIEVVVSEELDISTLPRLRERLEDALSLAPDRLVVDLSGCAFLDAQAMTVLLDVHRQAWRAGGLLTLRGCSPQCLRLLSLAGLLGVFDLAPACEPAPDLVVMRRRAER